MLRGFLCDSAVKNPPEMQERHRFDLWIGKFPWKRAWHPIPVFLPGESHGQKSLVDYSPWGLQRIDTAERLTLSRSLPRLDKPYISVYRF